MQTKGENQLKARVSAILSRYSC